MYINHNIKQQTQQAKSTKITKLFLKINNEYKRQGSV